MPAFVSRMHAQFLTVVMIGGSRKEAVHVKTRVVAHRQPPHDTQPCRHHALTHTTASSACKAAPQPPVPPELHNHQSVIFCPASRRPPSASWPPPSAWRGGPRPQGSALLFRLSLLQERWGAVRTCERGNSQPPPSASATEASKGKTQSTRAIQAHSGARKSNATLQGLHRSSSLKDVGPGG